MINILSQIVNVIVNLAFVTFLHINQKAPCSPMENPQTKLEYDCEVDRRPPTPASDSGAMVSLSLSGSRRIIARCQKQVADSTRGPMAAAAAAYDRPGIDINLIRFDPKTYLTEGPLDL